MERLEWMENEMFRLMDEATPLVQRLEVLKESCLKSCPFPTYCEERKKLLSEIQPSIERLHALQKEYDQTRQATDMTALVAALSGTMTGKRLPQGVNVRMALGRELKNSSEAARDFRHKAETLLENEGTAFQAAQEVFQTQRLLKRSAGVLSLLIVLSFGVFSWRKSLRCGPPPAPELQPGSLLKSGYRIDAELGRGSLGAVYEAADLAHRRKVALRHASPEAFQGRKPLSRFLAQARLAAALKHPHILETYAVFEEAGQAFQVFEFVRGKPLSAYVENGQRLPLRSAKGVLRQAAAALAHAHAQNVVHGGLKASKILITPEDALKIRDFAIALQTAGPHSAPELELGGAESASRESDIFSLGVLFYEILTGRPPYERGGLAQKRQMLHIPPTRLVPGLPPAVDELVRRALAADPRARQHSVSELAAEIAALPG